MLRRVTVGVLSAAAASDLHFGFALGSPSDMPPLGCGLVVVVGGVSVGGEGWGGEGGRGRRFVAHDLQIFSI